MNMSCTTRSDAPVSASLARLGDLEEAVQMRVWNGSQGQFTYSDPLKREEPFAIAEGSRASLASTSRQIVEEEKATVQPSANRVLHAVLHEHATLVACGPLRNHSRPLCDARVNWR